METSFLINIVVLSILALYSDDTDGEAGIAVYVSAAHCAIAVLLLLVFQLYQSLERAVKKKRQQGYADLGDSSSAVLPELEDDR